MDPVWSIPLFLSFTNLLSLPSSPPSPPPLFLPLLLLLGVPTVRKKKESCLTRVLCDFWWNVASFEWRCVVELGGTAAPPPLKWKSWRGRAQKRLWRSGGHLSDSVDALLSLKLFNQLTDAQICYIYYLYIFLNFIAPPSDCDRIMPNQSVPLSYGCERNRWMSYFWLFLVFFFFFFLLLCLFL